MPRKRTHRESPHRLSEAQREYVRKFEQLLRTDAGIYVAMQIADALRSAPPQPQRPRHA